MIFLYPAFGRGAAQKSVPPRGVQRATNVIRLKLVNRVNLVSLQGMVRNVKKNSYCNGL